MSANYGPIGPDDREELVDIIGEARAMAVVVSKYEQLHGDDPDYALLGVARLLERAYEIASTRKKEDPALVAIPANSSKKGGAR